MGDVSVLIHPLDVNFTVGFLTSRLETPYCASEMPSTTRTRSLRHLRVFPFPFKEDIYRFLPFVHFCHRLDAVSSCILSQYLGSEFVTRSTLQRNIKYVFPPDIRTIYLMSCLYSALYGLLDNSFERVAAVLSHCIASCMTAKTFEDPQLNMPSGLHVFRTVTTCLYECVTSSERLIPH